MIMYRPAEKDTQEWGLAAVERSPKRNIMYIIGPLPPLRWLRTVF